MCIGLGAMLGEGLAVPCDVFADMLDHGLRRAYQRRLVYLQVDGAVAALHVRIRTSDRITNHALRAGHVIVLTVNGNIFAFAEEMLLNSFRLFQYGHVEDIGTVRTRYHALVVVRDHTCLARGSTQVIVAMLNRSAHPMVRQVRLTNAYRVA